MCVDIVCIMYTYYVVYPMFSFADFVVCGDVQGNMWFTQTADSYSWSSPKPVRCANICAKRDERKYFYLIINTDFWKILWTVIIWALVWMERLGLTITDVDLTNGMSRNSGKASQYLSFNLLKCLVFNALRIRQVHHDRITVLRVTEHTIISASYDRTVKLWDRNTKKQVRHITGQILPYTQTNTVTDTHPYMTASSFRE